mgnify:CR=1 FL=1
MPVEELRLIGPRQGRGLEDGALHGLVPLREPAGLLQLDVDDFTGGQLQNPAYGYASAGELGNVVDLALFYGRNNLLINGDVGWVPGNVFATIVDGLDAMATACHDVWRAGSVGERLVYSRAS